MQKKRAPVREIIIAIIFFGFIYWGAAPIYELPPFNKKPTPIDPFSNPFEGIRGKKQPFVLPEPEYPLTKPKSPALHAIYIALMAEDATPQTINQVQREVGMEVLNAEEREALFDGCREGLFFAAHRILCAQSVAEEETLMKNLTVGAAVLAIVTVFLAFLRKLTKRKKT